MGKTKKKKKKKRFYFSLFVSGICSFFSTNLTLKRKVEINSIQFFFGHFSPSSSSSFTLELLIGGEVEPDLFSLEHPSA
jgi:hypothetical protein